MSRIYYEYDPRCVICGELVPLALSANQYHEALNALLSANPATVAEEYTCRCSANLYPVFNLDPSHKLLLCALADAEGQRYPFRYPERKRRGR